ncbi:MAG: hypothetical protein JO097_00690 [Acidobacteriaceae bacterium]|nr:hypothetical protein [Acidobacteriaceae bacterium]MBV9296430.1 hypothetical protein [Acidobacteriaceae bacterium]
MPLAEAPEEPEPKPRPALQRVLPYTTVAVILAALYVAWIFYSRYESNRNAQQAIEAQREQARKQQVEQIYGSGEIKFSTFSVDSSSLKRGETAQLCYGVLNAKTVKLDPPVEQAKPTYYHCVQIAPKITTTYKITADDGKGNSKSESLTVQVK